MAFLEFCAQYSDRNWLPMKSPDAPDFDKAQPAGLLDLLERSYWKRVWIIILREIMLASNIILHCGSWAVPCKCSAGSFFDISMEILLHSLHSCGPKDWYSGQVFTSGSEMTLQGLPPIKWNLRGWLCFAILHLFSDLNRWWSFILASIGFSRNFETGRLFNWEPFFLNCCRKTQ
jgi:hypothetical protein